MSDEITIGEFLAGFLPRLLTDSKFPHWPPDCFALCLCLLKRTGAYSTLFSEWPPEGKTEGALERWTDAVQKLGAKWRTLWRQDQPFDGLDDEWRLLCRSFSRPLSSIPQDRQLCVALMKLVAVADEASEGVGTGDTTEDDDGFLNAVSAYLERDNTLCLEIDCSRLRVLPCMHTPQNGLTERSLSFYLSLCDFSEVVPRWLSTPFIQRDSFNLLMIPWPFEVLVSEFRDVTHLAPNQLPETSGFFTYDAREPDQDLPGIVESLFKEAGRKLGRVDGVVLPELAVTAQQFHALRDRLPSDCFLVCGVGVAASASAGRPRNEVRLSFPPLEDVIQKKHHPWKLTESQIIQYGLGGVLSPFREWWEFADITDRQLSFISMSADIVLCVLICEDLARPDPVANLVRAVGPNLVIALLMDGPQTRERWAARYATVLADDPGCSVLAFTSLGMSRISRPTAGPSRSRVIAMWKDAFGTATEIEAPPGSEAVALSLSIRYREEYTADGRGDGANAAYPVLSGVHPIRRPGRKKER
jgi:predicted amidohydrolase